MKRIKTGRQLNQKAGRRGCSIESSFHRPLHTERSLMECLFRKSTFLNSKHLRHEYRHLIDWLCKYHFLIPSSYFLPFAARCYVQVGAVSVQSLVQERQDHKGLVLTSVCFFT